MPNNIIEPDFATEWLLVDHIGGIEWGIFNLGEEDETVIIDHEAATEVESGGNDPSPVQLVSGVEFDDLSFGDELPSDFEMKSTIRTYNHTRNIKLNQFLDLLLALSFAVVIGLGVGNFLGWSGSCANQLCVEQQNGIKHILQQKAQDYNCSRCSSSLMEDDLLKCCQLFSGKQNLILDEDLKQICTLNVNVSTFRKCNDVCNNIAVNSINMESEKVLHKNKYIAKSFSPHYYSVYNSIRNSYMSDLNPELKSVFIPIPNFPNVEKNLESMKYNNLWKHNSAFNIFDVPVNFLPLTSNPSLSLEVEFQNLFYSRKNNYFDESARKNNPNPVTNVEIRDIQDTIEMVNQNKLVSLSENYNKESNKQNKQVLNQIHLINANVLVDLHANIKDIVHFAGKLISSVGEDDDKMSLNFDTEMNTTQNMLNKILASISNKITDLHNFVESPVFDESIRRNQKAFKKMTNTLLDFVDKLFKKTENVFKKAKPLQYRLKKLSTKYSNLNADLESKWKAHTYKWMRNVNNVKNRRNYYNKNKLNKREMKFSKFEHRKFKSNNTNKWPEMKKINS